MPLTDAAIRAAKPKDKAYKLFDGGGLYVEITPSGGRWWRLKYRFNGKERRLSLGTYPEVPLAGHKINDTWINGARERREAARRLLKSGIDPSEHRKQEKTAKSEVIANTFEAIARECFAKLAAEPEKPKKTKDGRKLKARNKPETMARKIEMFERDVFPRIGNKPISKTSSADILDILKRIESRGSYEIAARVKMYAGQVFRYAVSTDRATNDPTYHLKEALTRVSTKHYAALVVPEAIGGLLRAIRDYKGYVLTRYALELAPLVFVRPGELRKALWTHVNLDKAEWSLPGETMKMEEPHIVPLSRQAVDILREVHKISGKTHYIFPSSRSSQRPMSENTVTGALRRMGFTTDEMTGHGFRAMARTVLEEVLGFRIEIIEFQLSHSVIDANGRAYNRTTHLQYRRKMMQKWADYLDELRERAEKA